jgi:hypothetical protein
VRSGGEGNSKNTELKVALFVRFNNSRKFNGTTIPFEILITSLL